MIKFPLENLDWYVSEQVLSEEGIEHQLSVKGHVQNLISSIFESYPEYREYIHLWGEIKRLPEIGILEAHGDCNEGWKYYDERGEHSVNRWIGSKDGKYAGLILYVCNPGKKVRTPKKSVLIIPDVNVNVKSHQLNTPGMRDTCFSLFAPGIGEIDPYKVDEEIKKLEEQ